MKGTAGQRRVPADFLGDASIPVPPSPEQERIVAKIYERFSELDAGVASLKRARALLKKYRQAVLKAAVTGVLTATGASATRAKSGGAGPSCSSAS
ncbi:MAG: hypothetical protein K0S81_3501 [Rhodospirillales bacterium]|nr:hypothetical protein [Rhodospirillales bacterium]